MVTKKEPDIQLLLKQAGNNLSAIDQIAHLALQRRLPLEPVLQAYKKFLTARPDSSNAAFNFAYYLSKNGQFEAAVNLYRRSLKLNIDAPEEVHLNIANIYMDHLKDVGKAREHLQKALALNNRYASAYHNLGNLSEQAGDRLEATRCFSRCLEIDPANETALARLADAHKFNVNDDPLLARLIAVARNSRNSDVHFAVGRAYEQLGQFEQAWQHFSKANFLDKPTLPVYRDASIESDFQKIISQCNSQWLNQFQGEGCESVFICGMFRTGSTLLEQVLAAHPVFTAGGESEFFPRLVSREFRKFPSGLDDIIAGKVETWREQHHMHSLKLHGDSSRVTDKRPDNFLHIGLIKAVLPAAKFVVTERDWRDVATSVFSTRLGQGQSYATSLKDIRHYIGLQKKLIDHWQSLLGSDLIRIQYEDLVTEPRETITGMLEALGESWDDNCLSFHQLRNSVQTASVWQVREPFHSKSVGRWRNYQAQFEEAFGSDSLYSLDSIIPPH